MKSRCPLYVYCISGWITFNTLGEDNWSGSLTGWGGAGGEFICMVLDPNTYHNWWNRLNLGNVSRQNMGLISQCLKGDTANITYIAFFVGRRQIRNNPKRFWICMALTRVIGAIPERFRMQKRPIMTTHTLKYCPNWLFVFSVART